MEDLNERELFAIAQIVKRAAFFEREDVLGVLLKTGALWHLTESEMVALSRKLEAAGNEAIKKREADIAEMRRNHGKAQQ